MTNLSIQKILSYAFLLAITIVFWLPAFHDGFVNKDEALYQVCAEKIVDGATQYSETWDNKPPFIIWTYTLINFAFGTQNALFVSKIIAILLIFISAILLTEFLIERQITKKLLPGFLYVFFVSTPWTSLELNTEIIVNLFMILSLKIAFKFINQENIKSYALLNLGVFLAISFFYKYQVIVLIFSILSAIFFIRGFKIRDFFSIFSGFFIVGFSLALVLYFRGNLRDFIDVGVLYNLDYIFSGYNPNEQVSWQGGLIEFIKYFGFWSVIVLIGFLNYRSNFFKLKIDHRRLENLFMLYLLGNLITILLGMKRMYIHYYYTAVPVIIFYILRFDYMKLKNRIKYILLLISPAFSLVLFGFYFLASSPENFKLIADKVSSNGWAKSIFLNLNGDSDLEKLKAEIEGKNLKNGILVMSLEPELYIKLQQKCATKYTNFSLAYHKMKFLHSDESDVIFSKTETLPDIYNEFKNNLPEYIIDQNNYFQKFQEKIPLLFAPYKSKIKTEQWILYKKYK